MKTKEYFMKEALRKARENIANTNGGPFGAVVVRNGEIIASGSNEVVLNNDPTAHAEVVAIRKACKALNSFQLDDCEIYASCEPCPMCLGAIYWARPKKVYYGGNRYDAEKAGFDDSLIYKEISLPDVKRKIPFEQINREAAIKVFKEWIESEKKIEY